MSYLLACDAGTTSTRSLIFDLSFKLMASSQKEFKQYTPFASAVEHDANEIWKNQLTTIRSSIRQLNSHKNLKSSHSSRGASSISAIGITNQRETIVAWDQATGEPLYHALVWQDQRTSDYCQRMKDQGHEAGIHSRTGLVMDPYFSASKIHWLLTHVPEVIQAHNQGRLCLGTIDSWLIFKLTKGQSHVTDVSNASRTLLMNIHTGDWDPELCALFGVPLESLPEILGNTSHFGVSQIAPLKGVPITGVAGDQQASLFGHRAFLKGDMKNTYGTGCFLLKNIGYQSSVLGGERAPQGVLETIAWKLKDRMTYAWEGSVMNGGSAVQFLRDNLGIIKNAKETEALALSLDSNEGVYFVPAFAGLGTPHWDSSARGLFIGMTRRTAQAQMARAALEAIAFQSADLMGAMATRKSLKVDGGATQNQFLMQFQADILGREVHVNNQSETTALGAAMMASIGAALLSMKDLKSLRGQSRIYHPQMSPQVRRELLDKWHDALNRSKAWA